MKINKFEDVENTWAMIMTAPLEIDPISKSITLRQLFDVLASNGLVPATGEGFKKLRDHVQIMREIGMVLPVILN